MPKKIEKGEFGYLHYKKCLSFLIMAAAFAIILSIFIIGLVITKTRNNMMTFISVILVLPAAKFAVSFFTLLPHHSCSLQLKEQINEIKGSLGVCYDMVFSNKTSPIGTQAVVISDSLVIAYTDCTNADKKLFEKSLKEFMASDGRMVNVTLYTDTHSFLAKTKTLSESAKSNTGKPSINIEKNIHSLMAMCF